MSTGRVESFSDGVLAVAITLLVLNLVVPAVAETHGGAELGHYLATRWPDYAAYAISFITIGIIWINHHILVGRLQRVDQFFMFANLLLLMSIAVLPFATNLMATYLQAPHGADLAAAIYGGSLLLMGICFGVLSFHTLARRPELLAREIAPPERRRLLTRSVAGVTPYVLATALAPVSPYVTLVITGAVAVFYALPLTGT